MPQKEYTSLNTFFVDVFNSILKIEEQTLTMGQFCELSIRELHIIEAVCKANQNGESNRISDIAGERAVTAGTMTVAVNTLVRKGYIKRRQDDNDKRIIRLYPTRKGEEANAYHSQFHHDMVVAVMDQLDIGELAVLTDALEAIKKYFNSKK